MTEYYRARAPLRLGIAGGGTDVDPYASEKGGCVFNATLNKYAYCTLTPRKDSMMNVHSLYYGRYRTPLTENPLKLDGNMDLIKAVANHFELKDGFDLNIRSDAPAGSGLGGSSTMIVALIGAVAKWKDVDMTKYEIAQLAYHLEREVIGLKGGKQDQYAAVFGGFNLIYFDAGGVRVEPVEVKEEIVNELQFRSVLCFTGTSRESASIITTQIDSFKRGDNRDALDKSKALAKDIGFALRKGEIEYAGELLDQSWQYKKQFSDKISNPAIDDLYEIAMKNGALGGKVSGAGGGGFMYFICEYNKKPEVAQKLQERGAIVTDFMFEPKGVTSWRSSDV